MHDDIHRLSLEGKRPGWFDDELFPFTSHWLDFEGARVHYVDEGEGPVLLMLHGQPTWSFLFRHLIQKLRGEFRCVALDYLGFGLSTAPPGYGYSIAEQVRIVEAFVEHLQLTEITPVMQDWGGPIGMAFSVRHPERVRGFVIGNTWAWSTDRLPAKLLSLVLGGPLGHLLVRRVNLFTRFMPKAMEKRHLTEAERAMYRGPHPTPSSREPLQVMPREIRHARPLFDEIEAGFHYLTDRPSLIIWGTRDIVFDDRERQRWEAIFAEHRTILLEEAGHFLWEDEPDEIADAIRDWYATRP